MIPWIGDSAKVIHVSKSGNDSNGGVAQQYPVSLANDSKLTIGAAVSACPDGGTIVIWPGDYAETVTISGKSINVIGTHRTKCRIIPTTGVGINLNDGCSLQNCYIYSSNSYAVNAQTKQNVTIFNCYVTSDGTDGIYGTGSKHLRIIKCFVFNKWDVVYVGANTLIEGCTLIGDACNVSPGSHGHVIIGGGASALNLILRDSFLLMQPCYGKGGGSPTKYEVACDIYGIYGIHSALLSNCNIYVSGYKETLNHTESHFDGDAYGISSVSYLSMSNSKIHTRTDQNKSKTAYSLIPSFAACLQNCSLKSEGQLASYDLYAGTAKTAVLTGCSYDSTRVHDNVTVDSAMDGNGPLFRAAKSIVNKAVQNKITGVIDYYDDDGQTIILTQIPTEAESTITRMPS